MAPLPPLLGLMRIFWLFVGILLSHLHAFAPPPSSNTIPCHSRSMRAMSDSLPNGGTNAATNDGVVGVGDGVDGDDDDDDHVGVVGTTTTTTATTNIFNNNSVDSEQQQSIALLLSKVQQIILQSHTLYSTEDDRAALERIAAIHQQDCKNTKFVTMKLEDISLGGASQEQQQQHNMQFQEINVASHPIGIQTLEPVLSAQEIATLQHSVHQYWESKRSTSRSSEQSSRFTFQRPGNSEAHLYDLDPNAQSIINDMLRSKVYPLLVQSGLVQEHQFPESTTEIALHVYDALFIRYNATKAATQFDTVGAGQPMHRDLGLVSVNIMLNNDLPSSSFEFQGGGTFFENQMLGLDDDDDENSDTNSLLQPLKPPGQGHALLHPSFERHAGAGTTAGIRDIVVLFITAIGKEKQSGRATPPATIQAALLKQCRTHCQEMFGDKDSNKNHGQSLICRIAHQLLAARVNPGDGEALLYLGTALLEYASWLHDEHNAPVGQHWHVLQTAKECLEHSIACSPCDSRPYNNMALVLTKLREHHKVFLNCNHSDDDENGDKNTSNDTLELEIERFYQKSLRLLMQSQRVNCDVRDEMELVTRNYGLFLANLDRFADACRVLEPVAQQRIESAEGSSSKVVEECYSLWLFCKQQTA